jgi:hypothetical protein
MRQTIEQQGGLSKDTRALMLYEANSRSVLVAYLLWFFLGFFGAHNFYLKRTGIAVVQLIPDDHRSRVRGHAHLDHRGRVPDPRLGAKPEQFAGHATGSLMRLASNPRQFQKAFRS